MKAVKLIVGALLTLIATQFFIMFMVALTNEPSRFPAPNDPPPDQVLAGIRRDIILSAFMMTACITGALLLYRNVLQPTVEAQKQKKAEEEARKKAIDANQSPTA